MPYKQKVVSGFVGKYDMNVAGLVDESKVPYILNSCWSAWELEYNYACNVAGKIWKYRRSTGESIRCIAKEQQSITL